MAAHSGALCRSIAGSCKGRAAARLNRNPVIAFERIQHGVGRMVAQTDQRTLETRLTRISHQAPARCIPLRSSSVQASGAAVVVLGNYGGGLLPGDWLDFEVHVQPKARLGLITQGSNRIYKQRRGPLEGVSELQSCKTTFRATVDRGGLLVLAPDPITPFRDSVYRQEQQITLLHPDASLCLVDWFSAGRVANGERWMQQSLQNTTKLCMSLGTSEKVHPVLIDSTILERNTEARLDDSCWAMDWSNVQFNAYASILLYGDKVLEVIQQCRNVQQELASRETRIRLVQKDELLEKDASASSIKSANEILETLSGRVLLGVSRCPLPNRLSEAKANERMVHVARLAATCNEDLYRILHYCLQPLSTSYGIEFYRDRIRASQSAAVESVPADSTVPLRLDGGESIFPNAPDTNVNNTEQRVRQDTAKSYWSAYILADSALPVGSFAHSAGLEAASQLNLLHGPADVSRFVRATTRSTLQLAAPLIRLSHQWALLQLAQPEPCALNEWRDLDEYAQAILVANEPACRASLDQGRSLLRVAMQWFKELHQQTLSDHIENRALELENKQFILESLQQTTSTNVSHGHLATILGVVTALWELSEDQACQLLGYCVARDIVSAAVRLNLVGPMASVGMLANAQQAAEQGFALSRESRNLDEVESFLEMAAGCAPVVDVIQPCHDLLSTRLFRT